MANLTQNRLNGNLGVLNTGHSLYYNYLHYNSFLFHRSIKNCIRFLFVKWSLINTFLQIFANFHILFYKEFIKRFYKLSLLKYKNFSKLITWSLFTRLHLVKFRTCGKLQWPLWSASMVLFYHITWEQFQKFGRLSTLGGASCHLRDYYTIHYLTHLQP